jgi:anti-sigma factor RsiW
VKDPCQEVLERLIEAVTGSVPPEQRVGVAEHLGVCRRCRDEAAAIEATVARLRAARPFAVPPGFWTEFMEHLRERTADDGAPALTRLRRWLASPRHALGTAAVTAAVAVAITAALRLAPTPPQPDPVQIRARALLTETMTSTLPSLGEMLETWRAGITPDVDLASDRSRP